MLCFLSLHTRGGLLFQEERVPGESPKPQEQELMPSGKHTLPISGFQNILSLGARCTKYIYFINEPLGY
jgi:hypothetical protein